MLIVKTFSYDPDLNPKVHEWCKKMSKSNFSDNMRNLIESQTDTKENDMFAELMKIQNKLDNMQIANVFAEHPAIENKQPTRQTIIHDDVGFNKNSLKNRYKL